MTASSFQSFAIGVLAVDLTTELGLNRFDLGLLGSVNTMVGAITAPTMGRITDRIGPSRSTVIILALSSAGMALMALGNNLWLLGFAALVSGIPQGWGNPATNALIARRVLDGARGTITGMKQSGVQFGIFLSGLTLPTLALLYGWRGAFWVYAAVFLAAAVVVMVVLDPDSAAPEPFGDQTNAAGSTASGAQPVGFFIWSLAAYGFLLGAGGGAVGRFLPLWANEVLTMSPRQAGLLVALGGLLGIAVRIAAGKVAEHLVRPQVLLSVLAVFGASYCGLMMVTPAIGSWILWPASIISAVGLAAWNAVAMLAVIMVAGARTSGRASGVVMLGFLGGLSISSPLAGWVVDVTGSYQLVWLASGLAALGGAAVLVPTFGIDTKAPPRLPKQA